MAKILAVFGATGQQGKSIVNFVLNDPELSKQYKIRAITRNVDSEQAKQLKQSVEVAQGDVSDHASLGRVLAGVDTVFAMTMPDFGPDGAENECKNGKAIADAAVAQGVKYIIFSTLPSVAELSGGKYTNGNHFEGKVKAERYIRGLKIKSAFISPGFFMSNFANMPFLGPQKASDGTWVIARHNSPKALCPFIEATDDTGKFVGAILADPDKYEGKTFCAATAQYSMDEVATVLSKTSGKKVVYKQISPEEWGNSLPFGKDIFVPIFMYPEEFGYYGPDTEKLVEWAAANARGKPTTLEEYFKANPLRLD